MKTMGQFHFNQVKDNITLTQLPGYRLILFVTIQIDLLCIL